MYLSLQLCRALAALMVVCFHVSGNLGRDIYLGDAVSGVERLFSFGDSGVAFFFVLSGFIVTWVHMRDFNQPRQLGRYLFKRAARIYPTYWILFGMTYAAACLTPSLRDTVPHDLVTIVKSLLLVPQDPAVVGGLGAPVLFVAWSLQYEMCFYLAMSLAVIRPWLLLVPLLLFVLNQVLPLGGDGYLHVFFANPRIYLFVLGVLLAYMVRAGWTVRRPWVLVASASAGFAALSLVEILFRPTGDKPAYALAYGAISSIALLGLIRQEDSGVRLSQNNWLVRLGDASYVLYLIHVPVMSVLSKAARRLSDLWGPFGPAAATLTTLVIVLACCAAAMIFHALIEKPLMHRLNGWGRSRRLSGPATA